MPIPMPAPTGQDAFVVAVKRLKLVYVAVMRGDATEGNPARVANYYYSDAGELLACYDPINGAPDSFLVPRAGL